MVLGASIEQVSPSIVPINIMPVYGSCIFCNGGVMRGHDQAMKPWHKWREKND